MRHAACTSDLLAVLTVSRQSSEKAVFCMGETGGPRSNIPNSVTRFFIRQRGQRGQRTKLSACASWAILRSTPNISLRTFLSLSLSFLLSRQKAEWVWSLVLPSVTLHSCGPVGPHIGHLRAHITL